MTPAGIALLGAGVLLVWAAVVNRSPVDVFRSALDPSHPEAGPISAGTNAGTIQSATVAGGALGSAAAATPGLAGLAEPLRSLTAQLLAEAAGRVYIRSGRRSTAEQIEIRRKNCGTTQYDIYQKPSSQCSPPTAIPGRSKHETGEAVDLGGDLALAARIGDRLGLHRPVRGENWHFEVRGR